MDIEELTQVLGTTHRFVRYHMANAARANKLVIEHMPGEGRKNYVDPVAFGGYLHEQGYVATARKLELFRTEKSGNAPD